MVTITTSDTAKSYLVTDAAIAEIGNENASEFSKSGLPSAWMHSLEVVQLAIRLRIPIDGDGSFLPDEHAVRAAAMMARDQGDAPDG